MKMLQRHYLVLGLLLLTFFECNAQSDKEPITAQIAIGVNNPIENGDTNGYFSNYVNFPTVNLGVQYFFADQLGAKLDVGYNRASSKEDSFDYNLNYTRVSAQLVYSFSKLLSFLPDRLDLVAHAGPGISFTKPTDNFSDNTYTFLNALAGFELHYKLSDTMTIFSDLGYVFSLAGEDTYDLNVDGFSFNDDIVYLTFGLSFQLTGSDK